MEGLAESILNDSYPLTHGLASDPKALRCRRGTFARTEVDAESLAQLETRATTPCYGGKIRVQEDSDEGSVFYGTCKKGNVAAANESPVSSLPYSIRHLGFVMR